MHFFLVLLLIFGQVLGAHAQQQQSGLARDEQLFEEARQLLSQKLYPDAIEKLKQAYFLSHAPRLLDNIAAVYVQMSQAQPASSSTAMRSAQEGLGYGRLYLQQEKDTFDCRIMDAIALLQQRAHPHPDLTDPTASSDSTLLAIREFELVYPQNLNPDLRYCVAAAYKRRGLDPSRTAAVRLPDVETALRSYKEYQEACKNADAAYTPRDCSGDIHTLQSAQQELRAELGRKIPLGQRTWFRVLIGTLVVGAAAGIATGVAVSVTRSSLIVPTEAWMPNNQFPAK